HDDERIEEVLERTAERDHGSKHERQPATQCKTHEGLNQGDAQVVDVEPGHEAVVEAIGYLARWRQDVLGHIEVGHRGFPHPEGRTDQHEAEEKVADTSHQSIPPPALSASRTRLT